MMREHAMIEPDEPRKKPAKHEIGSDVSALSVDELTERVAMLTAEIGRLEAAINAKKASRAAADLFFKA
jgi:uncharacterized small protein (DUF1192 family)